MDDTPSSSRQLRAEIVGKRLSAKGCIECYTMHATNYLFNGFRVLGIYMPARRKWLYTLYSLIPHLLVTIWLPLSFVFSYATMSAVNLVPSSLLTSIQVAINVIGCSVKIVVMAFLLPKLRTANAFMDRLDARCCHEDEIAESRKVVRQGNRFVVLCAMSYWSYATTTFLGSVIFGRPPYPLYNPFFDWCKSKLEFIVASLIEFALMDVACFQQVVDDSYAVIYVCILRAHMNILSMRIRKLATHADMSTEQNLEELRLCIIDHKNLLGLYNIIAPIISVTIFIQFMITATILSATLINIFIFADQLSTQIASCFYILAVVVEIFPLCYYVQCLMDDSERLSQQIFHSNWIEQDVRFRKMLAFLTQRTQRVMELNAGKIFPITLSSCLSNRAQGTQYFNTTRMSKFLQRPLSQLLSLTARPKPIIVVKEQPPTEPGLNNAQPIRLQFERDTRTTDNKTEHEDRPYGAVHDIHSKDGLTYLFRSFMALGVLMPDKHRFLYCLYAILPLGLITFYLPAAFLLSYFMLDYSDIKIGNLLTSVQVSIASVVGGIKLLVMAFKLPKLRAAAAIMSELDARCKDKDEIEVLRKVVRQGNRVLVLILICNLIYSTSTFLGAATNGRPPYNLYNPMVDWHNSKWEFVLASLWEFVLMDGLCAEEAITDSYAPIYVCIIRAHMKTLLMRIQKLGSKPERTLEENYEDLKLCIKDHKLLLKLFDIVHPIISTTYFLQFMTTSLMVGCTLLNIMIFAVDNSARVGHLCYVVALLMEVYPLCYYGQSLLDDSNLLSNTIFHGNWMEQNEDFRKMLVIFTQHTQKPMELLAGKLIPINLTTFVGIAKFSFTLYSFINNMGVKERFEGL